ncbi:ABC transporter ATP-binding protein [Nostoc sp. 3335mG]|nr:ABC transporter ATP-binding protein [Nostoc sp. 3335mG]
MTAVLETRSLAVGHGKRVVLGGIDVRVAPGEVVFLLGSNGIGKSTLLRTLARTQPPLAGSILIENRDIARMPRHDLARAVAIVLTERVAVGAMPAYRLVELGRYPHVGWSGSLTDRDRAVVQGAIDAVGAGSLAHRDIGELSDGERQRIMIARALAQEPALLLLDEPAAFLDIAARVETIATLRRLARGTGVGIVLSSHDLDLSLRAADTIWLLDGAGCLRIGAPEDLLADGSLAAAFSGPAVRFDDAARGFRLREEPLGTAFVEGAPDAAALARSVLEREGFGPAASAARADAIVSVTGTGWAAQAGTAAGHGEKFASLAVFLRALAKTIGDGGISTP